MPSVTYAALLNALAADTGFNRDSTAGTLTADDSWHSRAIFFLNRALRWCWADDPFFVWPATVTSSDAITVTSGVIAWSAVSSSDWCSFWRSDPRVAPSSILPAVPYPPSSFAVLPVPVKWDGTQFNVQDNSVTSPIFAFYRTACPQGTFVPAASTPTYATPTVPDFFIDPVVRYAASDFFLSVRSHEAASMARKDAMDWYYSQKAGFLNTEAKLPWEGNIITT